MMPGDKPKQPLIGHTILDITDATAKAVDNLLQTEEKGESDDLLATIKATESGRESLREIVRAKTHTISTLQELFEAKRRLMLLL